MSATVNIRIYPYMDSQFNFPYKFNSNDITPGMLKKIAYSCGIEVATVDIDGKEIPEPCDLPKINTACTINIRNTRH